MIAPHALLRSFQIAVVAYLTLCLLIAAAIVIRGDGPHPHIASIYPRSGDLWFPGGPVQVAFSQDMNHSSVEGALQVSPAAQGQGAWFGNTLNIQPIGDWKPNVTYHVQLTGKVTDTLGRPLKTPVTFWFRVHHITHLQRCLVAGVANVCEPVGGRLRVITRSPSPVLHYSLSPDGTLLAYTRRDASGLPHLFVQNIDVGTTTQLTSGTRYADSAPFWEQDDNQDVTYTRRPVESGGRLDQPEIWNVSIDGSLNDRIS